VWVFINQKFYKTERAKISVFDRGFLYGDAIFETMRAYNGYIFLLRKHVERLRKTLDFLEFNFLYKNEEIEDFIYKTLKRNKLKNAYIRVTVTRGEKSNGILPKKNSLPNIIIITKSFNGLDKEFYEKGVKVSISDVKRNPYTFLYNVKSTNILENIISRKKAYDKGFYEVIFLNSKGYLAEGSVSNLFFFLNDTLFTPPISSGILPGITREFVIEMAKALKIKVEEKNKKLEDLFSAKEVFITNSLIEILPVVKVEEKTIADGKVGSLTRELLYFYRKKIEEMKE